MKFDGYADIGMLMPMSGLCRVGVGAVLDPGRPGTIRAVGASAQGRPRVRLASLRRAALRASFHAARRTSSRASVAHLTTWNGICRYRHIPFYVGVRVMPIG